MFVLGRDAKVLFRNADVTWDVVHAMLNGGFANRIETSPWMGGEGEFLGTVMADCEAGFRNNHYTLRGDARRVITAGSAAAIVGCVREWAALNGYGDDPVCWQLLPDRMKQGASHEIMLVETHPALRRMYTTAHYASVDIRSRVIIRRTE